MPFGMQGMQGGGATTFGHPSPVPMFGGPGPSGVQTPTNQPNVSPSLLNTIMQPKSQSQPQQSGFSLNPQAVPTTPSFNDPNRPQQQMGGGFGMFGGQGQGQPQQPQGGLFGQSGQPQQGGLFGSKPENPGLTLGGIGQSQQQQGGNTGLFGQSKPAQGGAPSLFGGAPTQQSAAPSLFGGAQSTQPSTGLFGQPPQQPSLGMGQHSLFGGAQQQKPPALNFGQSAPGFQGMAAPQQAPQAPAGPQPHFLPNSIFVFSQLQPKGSGYVPTINGYKDFHAPPESTGAGDFSFLYQVPKQAEFSLSGSNPLNTTKVGELDPYFYEAIKKIDGQVRENQAQVSRLTSGCTQVGQRAEKLGSELLKTAALEAKDLNARIEQASQRFALVHSEFEVFQKVAGSLKAQVPLHSKEYMPQLQYPSEALLTLSAALTDKLEALNGVLTELLVFLEGTSEEDRSADSQFVQYIEIIDELFYCMKVLWARNQKTQEELMQLKGRLFAGSKVAFGRSAMLIEEESPSRRGTNQTLTKIIERSA